MSRDGLGGYVVHPADRQPNRADLRFATLAEADAYIDSGAGAAGADAPAARPPHPAPSGHPAPDPDIEIISQVPNPDGTTVVFGVVSGYTLRATCGAGTVLVHVEDLEIVGVPPTSELAQRLIDRWTQHLYELGYAERF